MAIENKYRVHEVAKDFGASTKEITEILTEYCTTPKNHMQVLGDEELSVIFEYMTQHNQVADLEQVLNRQASSGASDKAEKAEKPAKEQAVTDAPKEAGTAKETNPESEKPAQPASSKVKQVHRIDTRGTGDVNLAKYDDHVDKLVDAKAERMESRGQKKQKLTKKSDQRARQQYGLSLIHI